MGPHLFLQIAARKIDNIDDDTRLHPTLHNLHHAYAGESYAKTTSMDQISLESLEAVSLAFQYPNFS